MAYGQIYAAVVKPLAPLLYGSVLISIEKRDYVGSVKNIQISEDQISIRREFDSWEDHIIGMTLILDIQNDAANYFDFIDLMKAKEKEYFVKATHIYQLQSTKLFEGFINVELTTQKYIKYQPVRIVASSYLKKLEYTTPASIETLQNKTFIDIISECLAATGSTSNILVNVSYVPEEDVLTIQEGQTFLNLTGVYTELFWENNVDRNTSFEILKSILETFSLYLYWWNGNWYIEQYSDLWKTTKNYVKYTFGNSYGPTSIGTIVTETNPVRLIKTLMFAETSQTLGCLPGVRKNKVTLDLKEFLNLTINDFNGIVGVGTDNPIPPLRQWRKWQPMLSPITWSAAGAPYRTMTESIKRTIDIVGLDPDDVLHRGLYTQFEAKLTPEVSSLTVSFKYALPDFSELLKPYTEYKFYFHWYINVLIPDIVGSVFVGWKVGPYIKWSTANNRWELVYTPSNNEYDALQQIAIDSSEMDRNKKELTVEFDISDVWGLNPDINTKFVLCIGTEYVKHNSLLGALNAQVIKEAHIGDVFITVTGDDEPNVIEGDINEDYLTEKEYKISLADISSINYKNGILRGVQLESKSTEWFSLESPPTRPLMDWFLHFKTKQNNITRQRLTGDVIYKEYISGAYSDKILRPFTLFEEDKQGSLRYILTGQEHYPRHQKYRVQLDEYDKDTEITIIS